ncbi:hypothetical protein A2U01_0063862, partial [Trifolium medium]|nr:hypothetical protein [Trifolium medium]
MSKVKGEEFKASLATAKKRKETEPVVAVASDGLE